VVVAWKHAAVAKDVVSTLRHEGFGLLYRYGTEQAPELVGKITVAPQIRPPRSNGDHDVEVLIECAGVDDAHLSAHLDRCRQAAQIILSRMPNIREQVAARVPANWTDWHGPHPESWLDRLFLDGLEFSPSGTAKAVFDVGDLDQLCAVVDAHGDVLSVDARD
jgi:hypothetical protein